MLERFCQMPLDAIFLLPVTYRKLEWYQDECERVLDIIWNIFFISWTSWQPKDTAYDWSFLFAKPLFYSIRDYSSGTRNWWSHAAFNPHFPSPFHVVSALFTKLNAASKPMSKSYARPYQRLQTISSSLTFVMDAAVVQVSKPVVITRHEDLCQSLVNVSSTTCSQKIWMTRFNRRT